VNYTVENSTALSGAFTGPGLAFGIAFYLLIVIAMWRVFTKAGKAGWLAIIPIVNTFVLVKIAGKSYWWVLLLVIPFVNIVALVLIYNAISKAFGHGGGFTVGMVFLPFVFWPVLGFGSSTYRGPGDNAANGGNGEVGNYGTQPLPA
jgi:hypothetical protein